MAARDHLRAVRFETPTVEAPRAPLDDGEPPDDDGGMEARIAALEAANLETRDRLIKIETRMDSLASKEDVALTRSALQDAINSQTWRLITFVCSFGTALVAATYFIANHAK